MTTIHVVVSDKMKEKLKEFQRKRGYMTLSEAVRNILYEYFKEVEEYGK